MLGGCSPAQGAVCWYTGLTQEWGLAGAMNWQANITVSCLSKQWLLSQLGAHTKFSSYLISQKLYQVCLACGVFTWKISLLLGEKKFLPQDTKPLRDVLCSQELTLLIPLEHMWYVKFLGVMLVFGVKTSIDGWKKSMWWKKWLETPRSLTPHTQSWLLLVQCLCPMPSHTLDHSFIAFSLHEFKQV